MTSTFTLDTLRKETKRKFAPVTIEIDEDTTVELPSLLRLGKKDREAVLEILEDIKSLDSVSDDKDDLGDDDAELMIDAIGAIFQRISPRAKRLLRAIEDDEPLEKLSILTSILNAWIERTQPGEAGSSPA